MGQQQPAGWKLNTWLAGVGFSRSKFYTLPEEIRPASVDIAGSRIVLEGPREWLIRVARQQGTPLPPSLVIGRVVESLAPRSAEPDFEEGE